MCLEQLHITQHEQLPLYRRRYLSARQGQYDLYMLFIEQSLDLLNEGGRVAFSLSNSFLRTDIIRLEEAATRSVVRGHQLRGCQPPKLQHVYPFLYDAKGRAFVEDDLRARFPLMYAYLLRKQAELSKRALAKGCPWYSTFRRQPKRVAQGLRLTSAKITSGNSFSIIDDLQLLAHSSVVVFTDHAGTLAPYYLLGIVNSKIFTRYVSLTMPKINVGRYSLRLSRLRRFPVPDPACESTRQASQAISSLVHDLVQQLLRHPSSQELVIGGREMGLQ